MFNEVPFLERFDLAAQAGFKAVEFLFPYAEDKAAIRSRLSAAGLQQILFNGPPGDWEKGERGFAALPERRDEFRRSVELALNYAEALQSPLLHIMAGVPAPGSDLRKCHETYVENIAWAADQANPLGITITLEPLNPIDMPGYFLNSIPLAHRVIDEVGRMNAMFQFDSYHTQLIQGRVTETFREMLPWTGHVQVSGVPGRCEPDDQQEIDFDNLFMEIDYSGYAGWVGCEYRPRRGTIEGLGWLQKWRHVKPASRE